MDIQVRTIAEDEFEAWSRAEARGFSFHATEDYLQCSRSVAELDRSFGAFEGDQVVGVATTRTSGVTVPGGVADLGYIDDVSVLPTHRRRGILTRIMQAQLKQAHERGEPFAALSASESTIYERFGFGIASWSNQWSIDRQHTALALPLNAEGRQVVLTRRAKPYSKWRTACSALEGRRGTWSFDCLPALRIAVLELCVAFPT